MQEGSLVVVTGRRREVFPANGGQHAGRLEMTTAPEVRELRCVARWISTALCGESIARSLNADGRELSVGVAQWCYLAS